MTYSELCRTAVTGVALTMFGFGFAYAQELTEQQICEVVVGDVESAKGMVA